MPWLTSTWEQWLGWTLGYAAAYWAVNVVHALLESWLVRQGWQDAGEGAKTFLPLLLAAIIGIVFRSWWWVAGPPIAVSLLMLPALLYGYFTSPLASRRQIGTGYILAMFLILMQAGLAALAAGVGVLIGRFLPRS